jgi:RNA polymerase sigma-70 factor (ECF subfamily)
MNCAPLKSASLLGTGPHRVALASAGLRGFHSSVRHAMLYSYPRGGAELSLQFHTFDAGYVESLCAGDGATQEHFVGYFTELLRIKLRSRLQSLHAVEDVCQETFARVFAVLRKDGGLRQPERLGAFVNSVCNHVLFEEYRSSSRIDPLPELPATGVDTLEIVAARQIKRKVREILLDMPPRDRNLLKAIFLDERDRDEVCREFGVDREYLRVLLHRAKQEFKMEYVKRIGKLAPIRAEG